MNARVYILCALVVMPGVAYAKDTPLAVSLPASTDFRLLGEGRVFARDFRITPALSDGDVGPGDRPTSELCEMSGPDRPREPGARMKARMSMSLDDRDDGFRPAFSFGGVGAALVRLTGALLDQ